MHLGLRSGRYRADSRGKVTGTASQRPVSIPKAVHRRKKVYSFWSAAKFTFVLSLLLWWLPIFGQMIAGYVGGRKAGTPNKGMLAALIPVAAIMVIINLSHEGIIPEVSFLDIETSALIAAFGTDIPQLTVYMEAVVSYMDSFLSAIEGTTSLSLNSYIITVAFAYVGGILADQTKKEMDFMVSLGRPQVQRVGEELPRSWKALKDQKALQFECFDDCLPLRADCSSSNDEAYVRGDASREPTTSEEFFSGPKKDASKGDHVFSGLLRRAEVYDPEKERARYRRMNEDCDCV